MDNRVLNRNLICAVLLVFAGTASAATTATIITIQPTLNAPATNGTALLNAITTYKTKATAANPYILKLSPGQYNIGTYILQMAPYLDIEGSGQGTTLITGGGSATIALTKNADLRNATISNTFSGGSVLVCSNPAPVPGGVACDSTATPRISDVTIQVAQANQKGINVLSGSPIVWDTTVTISGALGGTVSGVSVSQNIVVGQRPVFLSNVTVASAANSATGVNGITVNNYSFVVLQQSVVGGTLANSVSMTSTSQINVQNSELHGSLYVTGGILNLATTMVDAASITSLSPGVVKCISSYNVSFNAVNGNCNP